MTVEARPAVSRAGSSTAERTAAAARVVCEVANEGRSLEEALHRELVGAAAPERAAVQALAFGTLRLQPRLDKLLAWLLDKPNQRMAPVIRSLLSVGVHQLEQSTHPPHAIVHETVEASRVLRAARASGLVNAVLRRYLRDRAVIEAKVAKDPVARHAHPAWLIEAIRKDWPGRWQAILEANNRAAPLWLRVNRRRLSVDDYLAALAAAGLSGTCSGQAQDAIRLDEPRPVHELPGFTSGDVSVQDAAAQLAAPLLAAEKGMRVLDACAAPGGKTCHLLERTPDIGELIALDVSPRRLQRVRENLERLALQATVLQGDARDPNAWWDGRPFDRILLDAPCSGTGVIRRHPDIKVLRRSDDIAQMAATQGELLRAMWPLLAPGGRLVYATCSVLAAENEDVIGSFLETQSHVEAVSPPIAGLVPAAESSHSQSSPGRRRRGDEAGLRIVPGEAGMDGFYYACLERRGP